MEYNKIIRNTLNLLDNNKEWRERYSNYAKEILENVETNIVLGSKHRKTLGSLHVYSTVSRMKSASSRTRTYGLRYKGQEVAEILVRDADYYIRTNEKYNIANEKYFDCPESLRLSTCVISDESAQKFIRFFEENPERKNWGKKNGRRRGEKGDEGFIKGGGIILIRLLRG